jgi:lipopolysaccharide-induced tumor necrosis factor-alpha factor
MDPKVSHLNQPNSYQNQFQPGFNVPPPPDYIQSTQYMYNPNSVVILQPISPSYISNSPMQLTCPNCRANVLTKINYKLGALPWLLCGGLCLFGLWCGCQFIPFCMNSCKDVEHYCSNCNRFLGVNRRI